MLLLQGQDRKVPGKNLKPLNGEPLLSYILKAAINASKVLKADVVLSTDSEEMQSIATSLGVSAPFLRPKHLAMDNVPSRPVQHAERWNVALFANIQQFHNFNLLHHSVQQRLSLIAISNLKQTHLLKA